MSLVLRRVLYPLFQKAGTVSLVPKGGCYLGFQRAGAISGFSRRAISGSRR